MKTVWIVMQYCEWTNLAIDPKCAVRLPFSFGAEFGDGFLCVYKSREEAEQAAKGTSPILEAQIGKAP